MLHGVEAAAPYYRQAMEVDSGLSFLNEAIHHIRNAEERYVDLTHGDEAIGILRAWAAEAAS